MCGRVRPESARNNTVQQKRRSCVCPPTGKHLFATWVCVLIFSARLSVPYRRLNPLKQEYFNYSQTKVAFSGNQNETMVHPGIPS